MRTRFLAAAVALVGFGLAPVVASHVEGAWTYVVIAFGVIVFVLSIVALARLADRRG